MRLLAPACLPIHFLHRSILCVICLAFALAVGGARLADDQQALVDLFASTGGPLWKTKTNWLSATRNACSWFGVVCGPANCSSLVNASIPCRVESVSLSRNNLVGTLPASIWRLDALRKLDLSRNTLNSSIPPLVGNLTSLVSLVLTNNRLEGSIPQFSKSSHLQELFLSLNRLTGTIPESIIEVSSLVSLSLSSNALVGSLPSLFCRLSSLSLLDISTNRLTGDLEAPCSFVQIPALRRVYAVFNQFSGRLDKFLLNMSTELEELVLSDNRISGEIPNSIGLFSRLQYLDLFNNSLSGTIPNSFTNLSSLSRLNLARNPMVSGSIPMDIGRLDKLWTLDLSSMGLSGSIPESIQSLTSLQLISFAFNKLSGSVPVGIDRLVMMQSLDFHSNLLSGTFPESLYRMSKLTLLRLSDNRFGGSISESIGTLSRLSFFHASNNLLTGNIPAAFSNFSNLAEFDISFNQIEGTLPALLTNPKLNLFDVRSNRISGTIPASLGTLPFINELYLGSNHLSGTVPAYFCSPSSTLHLFDLSDNQLSGFSAANLFSCPQLAKLDLSRNRIQQDFSVRDAPRLPPFINLSHNRLGPLMEEYSLPSSVPSMSVIDIRANEFLCPYTQSFPTTVSLLFSPCSQPWTLLLTYFAIFGSAVVLLLISVVILARFVSGCSALVAQSQLVIFSLAWAGECIGLILDSLTLQLILAYLSTRIDKCVGLNLYGFFGPLTNAYVYGTMCLDDPINGEFSPSTTISEFFAACRAKEVKMGIVASQFPTLCHPVLPQCDVDPVDSTCRSFYPELASDARGEVHRVFFGLVIAVAAMRLVVELARAACVFVACRRISALGEPYIGRCTSASVNDSKDRHPLRLYWMAELISSSPFAPLLYFATSRAEFTNFLLQREPTPADFAFRALHAGLLTSIPILAVNAWYLLRVTQYGLAPAGWLSLMKGLVLVPRLLFQAYRATRPGAGKHHRSAADAISAQSVDLSFPVAGNISHGAPDAGAPEPTVDVALHAVLGAGIELSNA